MPSQIDIWRILPTQDGGSVFESDTIELKNDSIVGSLSDKYASNGVWFCTGKDISLGQHPAPRKQYIVIMNGGLECRTTDGVIKEFKQGDIFYVEDTTASGSKGHFTKAISPYSLVLTPQSIGSDVTLAFIGVD